MTHPVDPEARAARFISLEVHESTHDRLVWGMRHNRDRAVADYAMLRGHHSKWRTAGNSPTAVLPSRLSC